MEIVALLRILWRRRLVVLVGLVLAFSIGLRMASATPTTSGIAWTTAVLDTKPSQVIAPASEGVETLGWRAELLGDLMLTEPSQRAIAKRLGLAPGDLAVIEPDLNVPASPTALPRRASEAAGTVAAPNVLTVTSNDQLATIMLLAAAPDPGSALRLADAAVDELRESAAASAGAAPADGSILPQPYEVTRSAKIESDVVTSGGGRLTGAAAAIVIAALWCGATIMFPAPRLRRRFRRGLAARRT